MSEIGSISLGPALQLRVQALQGRPDWRLILLDGYLDNQNSPAFLRECLKMVPPSRVLGFSLAGLTYISSTGVGALSSLTVECRQTGKFMFLTGVPDHIAKVLNLLGFQDLLSIIEDPGSYPFDQVGAGR